MSTRYLVQKLVNEYADCMIKALRLSHLTIKWHVLKATDSADCVAYCMWDDKKKHAKSFEIVIYHNRQKGRNYILGTMFHELLHIRMRQFDRLIKKDSKIKAHYAEEQFVGDIEKIIVDLL